MTLGVAVFATGRIVETGYVPAFKSILDAKLVAVLSRDQARSEAFAKAQGIPRAYSDLDALLADPAVDAVIVASPDTTHEAQVIASARAGKHILCEKPMSSTLASCKAMAAAVRASGVTFAMGYDNRFNQGLVRIREMIEAGEIGPVRYAHTHLTTAVSDPKNWRAAGDQSRYWAMSASGTHVVDIYRWYFGEPANVAGFYSAPVFGSEKDEIAMMVLDYPGRLMAHLTVAAVLPEGNRIELHGEKGTIVGERCFGRSNRQAFLTVNGRQVTVDQTDPFVGELRDFVDAIRDKRPPLSGLEDGVLNLAIMDRARESKSLHPV
jgi:1,5-anhydro-D-fructose reductase (1,5-anhydro-D-mannitol-forming)